MRCDVAVVGGGIVGLACAWEARRRGLTVALVEASPTRAIGASVRNFGMVWPIGQPAGKLLKRALRARERWVEGSKAAGFWHEARGSLHVAHHRDELGVLEEFVGASAGHGYQARMITAEQAREMCPWLVSRGLLGAMFSETELCVDPREAVEKLTEYLRDGLGVSMVYGDPVREVESGVVRTSMGREIHAERVCVCTGAEIRALFPEAYKESGLKACKLQMMRTAPQPGGARLGPMLAAGSTLRHYASFQGCTSLGRVRERFKEQWPEFDQWGIHVMASQTQAGQVTLGDSHEYGEPVSPFNNERIDELVLAYLRTFLELPEARVVEKWFGVYAKLMQGGTEFVVEPLKGVKIVSGVGGAGMTLSFGLAEEVFSAWEC